MVLLDNCSPSSILTVMYRVFATDVDSSYLGVSSQLLVYHFGYIIAIFVT